jgi:hypothetical protein
MAEREPIYDSHLVPSTFVLSPRSGSSRGGGCWRRSRNPAASCSACARSRSCPTTRSPSARDAAEGGAHPDVQVSQGSQNDPRIDSAASGRAHSRHIKGAQKERLCLTRRSFARGQSPQSRVELQDTLSRRSHTDSRRRKHDVSMPGRPSGPRTRWRFRCLGKILIEHN